MSNYHQSTPDIQADPRVFLGGINVGGGNKPLCTLPVKAAFSGYDNARAKRYFGVEDVETQDFFPILAQRALCLSKRLIQSSSFPPSSTSSRRCRRTVPEDVRVPGMLAETLQLRFSLERVKAILPSVTRAPFKQRLDGETEEALDRGAFGCPWFWVCNASVAEERFFESDRRITANLVSSLLRAGRDRFSVGVSGRGTCMAGCEPGSHGSVKRGSVTWCETGANDAC
ncbi:hypothetical protein OPT61_g4824 [Boeremia exigua]|uniref:Uncharacterized protein n=1 Tax=Boeremia exigua TaxID=749465 RepID=A0ACC2ICU9_9PLEO|nr:hypothetical protein OPT61_g4824 [Boeremia exigua]